MKEKEIEHNGEIIRYQIRRHKKAKCMRLSIKNDASVVVTVPDLISEMFAKKFVIQKADWILNSIDFFKNKQESLIKIPHKSYYRYKAQSKLLIKERIKYYNKFYNYSFNRICVKNHKSRWGSCSSGRNLNFNYRLLFLPSYLSDYIIVHELCHLGELNHSKNFWNLVSKTIPDHKKIRKELEGYYW